MSPEIPLTPNDTSDLENNKTDFMDKTNNVFEATRVEGVDVDTQVDTIDGFLKTVEESVKAGEVVSREGVPFTWPDILQRLNKLEGMLNGSIKDPEIKDPFSLLPRSNNLRAAFVALIDDMSTASTLLHEIIEYPKKLELKAENEPVAEKVRRDFGEGAVKKSGIKQPEGEIISAPGLGKQEAAPESAQAEVSAEETERAMLERFAREYQTEKSRLYAELRGVEPTSLRAAQLENQINLAKEDIERVDKRLRNLQK